MQFGTLKTTKMYHGCRKILKIIIDIEHDPTVKVGGGVRLKPKYSKTTKKKKKKKKKEKKHV